MHESHYCFYLRKTIRHFGVYTNCGHEGTNNGIKHNCTPVTPQTPLHKCATILSANGERQGDDINGTFGRDINNNNHFTQLKCANELVSRGACILQQQWDLAPTYVNVRAHSNVWVVIPSFQVTRKDPFIPVF